MRRLGIPILIATLAAPAALWAGDFERVVHEFSRQSGATQTHIPFFFAARAAVAIAHPAGTSQINLAIFENASFDPDRFSHLTDSAVLGTWKPMIRVRSKDGESTNIYSRPSGHQIHLLIATYESNEATFVELKVEPEALMQFVSKYENHESHSREQ